MGNRESYDIRKAETGSESSLSESSGSSTPPSTPPTVSSSRISRNTITEEGLAAALMSKSSSARRNSGQQQKRRSDSGSSSEDAFGWFEDFDSPRHESSSIEINAKRKSSTVPTSKPPFYILESSLETQKLWYQTAGKRPKQPEAERKYFESLWEENLKNSIALGHVVQENLKDWTSLRRSKYEEVDPLEEVWFKGHGSFSNAVSRAFLVTLDWDRVITVTIQIPRFKIASLKNGEARASFLVVVSINGVHYGRWKSHSEFRTLADKIQITHDSSIANTPCADICTSSFRNSILSWQCVLHRKPWFRCLDKEYLALKCFLLERFMHDVLFESHTPELLSAFIGVQF